MKRLDQVNSMEGIIESALKVLEEANLDELPAKAFKNAYGIVILEIVKSSFLCAAQMGSGILLRHDKETQTWGPPLAVGLTGVGLGFGLGVEKKSMIMFLTGDQMAKAMSSDFSLRLGVQSSWAWGNKGEGDDFAVHIGNKGSGNTYGYSSAKGAYKGTTADGMILAPRSAINEAFYGQKIQPKKLSFGQFEGPPCESLQRLQAKLSHLEELADAAATSDATADGPKQEHILFLDGTASSGNAAAAAPSNQSATPLPLEASSTGVAQKLALNEQAATSGSTSQPLQTSQPATPAQAEALFQPANFHLPSIFAPPSTDQQETAVLVTEPATTMPTPLSHLSPTPSPVPAQQFQMPSIFQAPSY